MNEIEIYQAKGNEPRVEVRFEGDTVWLSQAQIAGLFQKDRTVITRHLNNVFREGELDERVVCANFAHTTKQ